MKVATASIFAAAALGSTVGLSGSSPPSHSATPAAQAQQASSSFTAPTASRSK
jgi:hypothetical protein